MNGTPLGAVVQEDGSTVIAATRRPDGTWRKERRVRDGYIAQDEIGKYKSPAQQLRQEQQRQYPIGWDPNLANASTTQQKSKSARKNEARKLKKQQEAGEGGGGGGDRKKDQTLELKKAMGTLDIHKGDDAHSVPVVLSESEILSKKKKALVKKLRQVEELQEKVNAGGLTPWSEVLEKLVKRERLEKELAEVDKAMKGLGLDSGAAAAVGGGGVSSKGITQKKKGDGGQSEPSLSSSSSIETKKVPSSSAATSSSPNAADKIAKARKALRKKLKQIEELKAKVQGGDVTQLSEEQKAKIARKPELQKQLKEMT